MNERITIDYTTRYKYSVDYEKLKAQVEIDRNAISNGTYQQRVPIVHTSMSVEERIAKMEDDLRRGKIMSFDYSGGLEQWKDDLRSGRYGNRILEKQQTTP